MEGSGPPLLVFHGWSGSSHNIERWLPALTPRFRVFVPDLPGCAGITPLPGRHTAVAYAAWAVHLMDQLGLTEVRAAGLCSGTSIALSLAAVVPQRVRGLLLHTPFIRPGLIRRAIRAQLGLLASPLGGLFGPLSRSDALANMHRRVFANAAEVAAEQVAHDQADMRRADVRANRELARDLLTLDRSAVLAGWKAPLAVLFARSDAFVDTAASAAAVRELVPHAVIEIIDGGHGWTTAYVRAQHDALARLAAAL